MKTMKTEKQFIYKMSRDQYDRCFTSEKYFYSYNPDTDEVCISVSVSERVKILKKMKKLIYVLLVSLHHIKKLETASELAEEDH